MPYPFLTHPRASRPWDDLVSRQPGIAGLPYVYVRLISSFVSNCYTSDIEIKGTSGQEYWPIPLMSTTRMVLSHKCHQRVLARDRVLLLRPYTELELQGFRDHFARLD